jgi:Cof subfamily protein (haloacid dehalogenase superfamily)
MSDYQIAAIDLDDTLLRSDGSISDETVAQLLAWQAMGRQIVIATGRPPRSIGHALPEVLHSVPWVCYNGAEIRLRDECIYTNHIPEIDAQTLVEQILAEIPNALIGLEIDGQLYLNRHAQRSTPYEVAALDTLRRPAAKVLIFSETREPLARLAFTMPPTAQPLYSARYPHFIQILATDCNKATALLHLVADQHVDLRQVVAFGDDTNDVEMVAMCGLGVAMGNAVDEVKAVADRITTTNDEEGVARILAQLLTQ